jgi:arylsulfatase A-like enzyme
MNLVLCNYNKVATFVLLATVMSLVFGTAMRSWTPLYGNVYAQSQSPTTSERPNFLVIVGDDFGYSDIGAFGSEISTPNLDAIAGDGKVLTDYHTAPTCSPARVALLTGVDWHVGGIGTMYELIADNQIGKPGYETYINDKVVTVAELLRDSGYNTMMSGKWHLSGSGDLGHNGSSPYDRGFENVFTLLQDGSNHWNDKPFVPGYHVTFMENNTKVSRPGNNTVFDNEMYTDKILEYLNKTQSENKPFLAYLAFVAAHSPFQAPPENIAKYEKIYSVGWDEIREQRFDKQKELGFWPSNMSIPERLPPNESWENLTNDQKSYAAGSLAVHAAMIEDLDKNVGRVIQYLKDTGQYDNTFIMFTSDNGSSEPTEVANFRFASGFNATQAPQFVAGLNNSLPNFGKVNTDFNYGPWGTSVATSPLTGFKTSFYEGGTRPPFIIKAPQTVSSPTNSSSTNIINSFAHVTDITPTILELANVTHPTTYQGREVHSPMGTSLVPLLDGTMPAVHAANETIPGEIFNQTTVRMGDWKALHDASDKPSVWRLYNLADDLGESTNVADQHPDLLQTMTTAYDKFAQDVGVVIPRGAQFEIQMDNLFPTVNSTNVQTISLADMLVPGYESELKPTVPVT